MTFAPDVVNPRLSTPSPSAHRTEFGFGRTVLARKVGGDSC